MDAITPEWRNQYTPSSEDSDEDEQKKQNEPEREDSGKGRHKKQVTTMSDTKKKGKSLKNKKSPIKFDDNDDSMIGKVRSQNTCPPPINCSLITENPYAVEYIHRHGSRSMRREASITYSQPKLEKSLLASIFGEEALQTLIKASFNCQERLKQPGTEYFSETLEQSTEHTEEEIRQSIIALSGRFHFSPFPTPESRSQIHRLDPSNPYGEEHGLIRIPVNETCNLQEDNELNSSEFRIFFRVIKGSIQIESRKWTVTTKKCSFNTEIEIPPLTDYKLSNPNCVSCLLYYTIENAETIDLRKKEDN